MIVYVMILVIDYNVFLMFWMLINFIVCIGLFGYNCFLMCKDGYFGYGCWSKCECNDL